MSLVWRRRVGGVVWGFGVVVALIAGWASRGGVEARGIGHAPAVVVSVAEPALLASVDAGLHQMVQAGDVVARVDEAPIVAALSVAEAELLVAQEEAAMAAANEARRFAEGREGAALDRAQAVARLAESQAALAAANERLAIAEGLVADGAAAANDVLVLRQARDLAQAQVNGWSMAVSAADAADVAAEGRVSGMPEPSRWAVVAATRRVEALQLQLARAELRAPMDGRVRWVHRQPGEALAAGDPILEIQAPDTDEVVAWLPPSAVGGLAPGAAASVIRSDGAHLAARLVSLGAGPRELPEQLWHSAGQPEWGVPARVRLEGGTVAPDEAIVVRL